MRILDRLTAASRKLDRSVYERTRLDKLTTALRDKPLFSLLRTAEARYGTLMIASVVVAIFAAAVIGPGSGTVGTTGQDTAVGPSEPGGLETTALPTDVAESVAGTPRRVTRALPPSVQNPFAETEYARKIGAMIYPQSTSAPNRNSWAGVTDKEIKMVISMDEEQCGVDTLVAIQSAGGLLPTPGRYYRPYPSNHDDLIKERKEAIDHIIRYWNDFTLENSEDLPNIRPLMGDDPTHPFFGRRLTYEFVDGGSFQCRDKATQAAIEIVDEIGAFGAFSELLDASASFALASALHAKPANKRPMHFGTMWLSDKFYNQWAPFNWTSWASGSTNVRQFASYVCSRLVGKKASNSQDATISAMDRKFGFVHPNLEQSRVLANEFKALLNDYCGRNIIAVEFEYTATDVNRAQDESNSMAVAMRTAPGGPVTSILMVTDLFYPLFQIQAAYEQRYFPEWVWSGQNYTDVSSVQRLYGLTYGEEVNKASFGISNLGIPGGFGYQPGNDFYVYHTYHQTSTDGKKCDPSSDAGMNHPGCKAPQPISTWYYTLLPPIAGMIFAGPDLKPINVSKGLQAFPQTRYGTAGPTLDPRPALVGAGPGKYAFLVDAVEWRWRQNYISPLPEHKGGWIEYMDCQRHYINWPNQLAVNWETNGPNYNAWCGDAKYAPPKNPPNEDLHNPPFPNHSGTQETDNYPRLD